jgi:hypothetical protein
MEWMQLISIFLANAGLIAWFRSESRSDWRHMDEKVEIIRSEMKDFREKWAEETREFRERLFSLEERRLK